MPRPSTRTAGAPPAPPKPDTEAQPLPQASGAPAPAKPAPAALTFSVVSLEEVPEFVGSRGAGKYRPLADALKALAEGKALTVPLPAPPQAEKLKTNILTALRKSVPNTRSRSAEGKLYLWIGEAQSKRRKGGK